MRWSKIYYFFAHLGVSQESGRESVAGDNSQNIDVDLLHPLFKLTITKVSVDEQVRQDK